MKLTRRIKKVLLFLLHPKTILPWVAKTFPWFIERYPQFIESNYTPYFLIKSFCEKKRWKFAHSENVSYARTFKIMRKLGLIEDGLFGLYSGCRLTDKGRKLAEEIKKEMNDFIKEYQYLIS